MEDKIFNLSARSLEIFRELVDAYIETGEAVGSRLLSKRSPSPLSSATIRNIMADLEDIGLLYAPHTSAGRIPTETGLRFFVDELLEVSNFEDFENEKVFDLMNSQEQETSEILEKATSILSGLSKCAGVVSSPKTDPIIQKINFVSLSAEQILVIIVSESGHVENRIISAPANIDSSLLQSLSNYMSHILQGRTLSDGIKTMEAELSEHKNDFDQLSAEILQQGIEIWKNDDFSGSMILKGHANLLENIEELRELNNIRDLFEIMETKHTMLNLLNFASKANGIQVFIGSENPYFQISGCSLVLSPYKSADGHVVGAIGVIGPAHMKYRKIIPLVNYTSKIISKILNKKFD
ncbi:MAG: heat-inducible transcriptional repressor HrcA [Holosporales bacterium]|jgi:heat-inducible transcriptional repressor|nr:heat-inducible transcriptional repressor HrcA [Holosporales bacterium]